MPSAAPAPGFDNALMVPTLAFAPGGVAGVAGLAAAEGFEVMAPSM